MRDVTIGIVWQSTPKEIGRSALAGYGTRRDIGEMMAIELASVLILGK